MSRRKYVHKIKKQELFTQFRNDWKQSKSYHLNRDKHTWEDVLKIFERKIHPSS